MDLFFGRKKLDVSSGFSTKGKVIEPKFIISKRNKRAFKLEMVITNKTNLWSRKSHAANNFIAKMVVKTSSSIDGNLIYGFFGFLHIDIISEVKVGFCEI